MSKRDEPRPTSYFGSPHSSPPPTNRDSDAPSLPDFIVRDILAQVQQALGRFATPGEVRFQGCYLYLEGGGGETTPGISIAAWAGHWSRMDEASRRRRAEEVARILSHERAAGASLAPARRVFVIDLKLALAVIALAACALYIAFGEEQLPKNRSKAAPVQSAAESAAAPSPSGRNPNDPQSNLPISASEISGEARSSRTCAATLTRIFQGGSVSVADADGFRVEIALLGRDAREPLDTNPALRRFVEKPNAGTGSRFIWKEESGLAPVETRDSVVVVRRTVLGEGEARIFGVTLAFGGSLVDPYFKEEERNRYFHIAAALSDALQASHTAVYARCFDRPVHALGSWFRGPDTRSAISSLVYFMGTYARPLHLAKPYYQPPGEEEINRFYALTSIEQKTAPLTRVDLATLLGKEGGMATGRDGEGVIITFPFGDGNRASRASRGIVRVAGLGL